MLQDNIFLLPLRSLYVTYGAERETRYVAFCLKNTYKELLYNGFN
jgi:hypothetical protein